MTEKDKENKAFYDKIHFFGYEDEPELREDIERDFEEFADDYEDDDDNDDILISENF